MPLSAAGMRTVMRQVQEVKDDPVDGTCLQPSDDLSELRFAVDGPEDTPFAAGRFMVSLVFEEHYPQEPPKGFFRTKVFHPNVGAQGEICVNTLKKDWQPSLGLRHILQVIRCLLVAPNPASALNEEAGRLLLEDYASFEKKALMFTSIHALRPAGVPRFSAPAPAAGDTKAAEDVDLQRNPGLRALEGNNLNYSTPATATSTSGTSEKIKKKTVDKKKAALKRI